MIALLFAAALAVVPAQLPASDAHKDHAGHAGMKHDGDCCGPDKDCCKGDKAMPCCAKAADKPAEAPAPKGHGSHQHDH